MLSGNKKTAVLENKVLPQKKKTVRGLFLYEPIALNHGDLDKMAINWNNIS